MKVDEFSYAELRVIQAALQDARRRAEMYGLLTDQQSALMKVNTAVLVSQEKRVKA